MLYEWSENGGVRLLNQNTREAGHLTSLAFSSTKGRKCILAFGRSNRYLGLSSLFDDAGPLSRSGSAPLPRFEVLQPAPISCLSWRPTPTPRPSKCPAHPDIVVDTEDLLVADEQGAVYYFAVEWPHRWEVERHNWAGCITLMARICVHTQQICGLAWSPDGELFATGGNDNLCCLFETNKVLTHASPSRVNWRGQPFDLMMPSVVAQQSAGSGLTDQGNNLTAGNEKYRWVHGAAVKAIAFCPWQDGLVATGGGSNDKCIHFFHTTSGAALATIAVSAQVTSLIWSTTRREIAATLGYAQPEHSVRIAVFAWPDCRQVATIPWEGEHRALYAIPYPGGPEDVRLLRNGSIARKPNPAGVEGCIIVASSDKSVKFHEVWTTDGKATPGGVGMLGGSDILESLEGIDREGDVIR